MRRFKELEQIEESKKLVNNDNQKIFTWKNIKLNDDKINAIVPFLKSRGKIHESFFLQTSQVS